ncbi:MAG: ABC transporter ATP-binding protein [Ruthenibacterium sp.]
MEKHLQATGLTKTYGKTEVLHGVNLTIAPGKIYGMIGRNGAGKTTLLSILAAQNTASGGTVTYDDAPVWENQKALDEICFSREIPTTLLFGQNTLKGKEYLRAASAYYPRWDADYAQKLVTAFGLDPKKKVGKMSKGMLSMLTIVIALASRAPITMMDEPVAGLDVVAREQFYDFLLADYTETNRTFLISTHIIEEAATVFEEIIFVDHGDIIAQENTEQFLSKFHVISGKDDVVDAIVRGMEIVHSESFGRSKSVCVRADAAAVTAAIGEADVSVSGMSLQKAFVAMTKEETPHA